jgi:hypothetical protein
MIAAFAFVAALAVEQAAPSPSDKVNIALSMRVAARVGDRLWPNWSKTPFVIDLLTAGGPVMVNATEPSPAPSFPPNLEATFPLSNGVPTIVIGEPQFTAAKTPVPGALRCCTSISISGKTRGRSIRRRPRHSDWRRPATRARCGC